MDTYHGKEALKDGASFTISMDIAGSLPCKRVYYDEHRPEMIRPVPPKSVIVNYEADYKNMQENMFAWESLSWESLIDRLNELHYRINGLIW